MLRWYRQPCTQQSAVHPYGTAAAVTSCTRSPTATVLQQESTLASATALPSNLSSNLHNLCSEALHRLSGKKLAAAATGAALTSEPAGPHASSYYATLNPKPGSLLFPQLPLSPASPAPASSLLSRRSFSYTSQQHCQQDQQQQQQPPEVTGKKQRKCHVKDAAKWEVFQIRLDRVKVYDAAHGRLPPLSYRDPNVDINLRQWLNWMQAKHVARTLPPDMAAALGLWGTGGEYGQHLSSSRCWAGSRPSSRAKGGCHSIRRRMLMG